MKSSIVVTLIANANAAKTDVINDALNTGDLKALALAIRPLGEFARVSCPSSMEFGDRDIEFHGKRLAWLADGHESNRDHVMTKVGRIADRIRNLHGQELRDTQAERSRLQGQAMIYGETVRRIDTIIAVLKEELSLRTADRAAFAAKVTAERATKAAAERATKAAQVVAVIQPEVCGLPAKAYKRRVRFNKSAPKARADRSAIRYTSLADLAGLAEDKAVNEALLTA